MTAAERVQHPLVPELNRLYGHHHKWPAPREGSTQANVCVFADREVDRSPTGTGTAGRVAQLYARGRLKEDVLVNESIIGTVFTGRVAGRTKVGDFEAVVPEVSGERRYRRFQSVGCRSRRSGR